MSTQPQPRSAPQARPEPLEVARLCARIADEKKGGRILILDVAPVLVITSYFVIVSGDTGKQLQAIAEAIHAKLKPLGVRRYGREGYEEGRWILLDYGDVVVHLLVKDLRDYYNLETIWDDAARVAWESEKKPAPAGREEEE